MSRGWYESILRLDAEKPRCVIHDCQCGRKYIKTRGEEQKQCLICIQGLPRQGINVVTVDLYEGSMDFEA